MLKIRKNDIVILHAGKDKGKKGKVLTVIPKRNRAIVEGVSFIKRHTRKTRQEQQGGIVRKESPVHISNLLPFCNKCNKATKVGFTLLKNGSKARICKSCREVIG